MTTKKSPKVEALKVPAGTSASSLSEKAAKAVEIRKSAAAARQGKSLSFPSRLQRAQ